MKMKGVDSVTIANHSVDPFDINQFIQNRN